jgi:hypothetical protein
MTNFSRFRAIGIDVALGFANVASTNQAVRAIRRDRAFNATTINHATRRAHITIRRAVRRLAARLIGHAGVPIAKAPGIAIKRADAINTNAPSQVAGASFATAVFVSQATKVRIAHAWCSAATGAART